MSTQLELLKKARLKSKQYLPLLSASENGKGVLDVDTVKGCAAGVRFNPLGCYDECYAAKTARRYGIDFATSVVRELRAQNRAAVFCAVRDHSANWYRIGVAGDPSFAWAHTLAVCLYLRQTGKVPVVITKHWQPVSDKEARKFAALGAVFNTSVSALDTGPQLKYRLRQIRRLELMGIKSVARVVTCGFGSTAWAKSARKIQDMLLSLPLVIDNPLRAASSNVRVQAGDITLTRRTDAVGGGKFVSLHSNNVYLGNCFGCPDQCGVGR